MLRMILLVPVWQVGWMDLGMCQVGGVVWVMVRSVVILMMWSVVVVMDVMMMMRDRQNAL
jgi:hypothetical protein